MISSEASGAEFSSLGKEGTGCGAATSAMFAETQCLRGRRSGSGLRSRKVVQRVVVKLSVNAGGCDRKSFKLHKAAVLTPAEVVVSATTIVSDGSGSLEEITASPKLCQNSRSVGLQIVLSTTRATREIQAKGRRHCANPKRQSADSRPPSEKRAGLVISFVLSQCCPEATVWYYGAQAATKGPITSSPACQSSSKLRGHQ